MVRFANPLEACLAYFLAPAASARPQFFDSSGNVLAGGFLYWYEAGTTTPLDTFTDSTGATENDNPLELNSAGRPDTAIYLTEGESYKLVVKDSAGVTIFTQDNIVGIATASTASEWQSSGLTPTYLSATTFSVPGDQTTDLHPGRRLKITDAGGTKYGRISASAFTTLTTVTVELDSSTLATPVTAVSWGLLTATNPSVPSFRAAVHFDGILSPTQITGNQNDYSPTSLAAANVLRLSSDARRNLTGLAGGQSGRLLTVHNVGTFPIVFKYEDTGSTAANRFAFACSLGGGQTIELHYDSTSSRWRCKAKPEPLGTIKDFGTSTMPEDFLAIDQNVSRTTYAALYNEIGTSFGEGDGSTTFGLFIGKGASLIAAGTGTQIEDGVDADVDTGNDTLTVPSNDAKWITGMAVLFNLTSGTITGLTDNTTYYVVRNSSTTIKLASTLANAQNGTVIDLTAKSTPVWDITHTYTARTHGQRLGEEGHAMSSTELLAHLHSSVTAPSSDAQGGANVNSATGGNTGSTGGNAAMNIMQPSTVVTRGIRYC